MRQIWASLALVIASCSPAAEQPAQAQTTPNIEACVAAAPTRDALQQCKGIVLTPCLDEPSGQTTAGMIECGARESEAWQTLLDSEIARLNSDDASRGQHLAAAQEAWTAWRAAECRYQASESEGGSLAGVASALCNADITADRVVALLAAQREAPPQ